MKSGNLNLLEPSGPVQACKGIALPVPDTALRVFIEWEMQKGRAIFVIKISGSSQFDNIVARDVKKMFCIANWNEQLQNELQ